MPKKKSLLIVEDDQKVSALYRKFLSEELFDVTIVTSGRRALEAHEILKPDIVILDINLPDMSGLDVLREIRTARSDQNTCVIIASASSKDAVSARFKHLYIQGYLTKPFDLGSLNDTILESLETPRGGDEAAEIPPGVLIVEDDSKISALYEQFLDEDLFEVRIAKSADEAITYLESNSPEIIILDLELPGMSGIDFLKEMRNIRSDIATTIVIASSHSREEIVKECLRYNIQGFLVKPFNVKQLTQQVLRFRHKHMEELKRMGWTPELL
ncbi:MAG: response regulator [Oceanidesulfovibrio sp.]